MNNNSRTLLGLAFIALLALLPIGGCGRGGGALPPSPVVTESFRTDDDKNVALAVWPIVTVS